MLPILEERNVTVYSIFSYCTVPFQARNNKETEICYCATTTLLNQFLVRHLKCVGTMEMLLTFLALFHPSNSIHMATPPSAAVRFHTQM